MCEGGEWGELHHVHALTCVEQRILVTDSIPSMAFACLLVCLLACLSACVLQRFRVPILMRFHRPQHPGIAHASVASLLEHREGLQPSIVPALSRHGPRAAGSNLASRHGGRQREETQ